MKKVNAVYIVLIFLLVYQNIFAQNYLTFTPLSQEFKQIYKNEFIAKVKISCTGNLATPSVINLSTCNSDTALKSITFSNGTALLPGQNTVISFKFYSDVKSGFNYKFSLTNNCSDEAMAINIIGIFYVPNFKYCSHSLLAPTNVNVSDIQNNAVNCSWDPISGSDGYKVGFRKKSENVGVGNYEVECCGTAFNYLSESTIYDLEISGKSVKFNNCGVIDNGYLKQQIVNCPPLYYTFPRNIQAIPTTIYQYVGYTIKFAQVEGATSYAMEWVDLVTNQAGSTTIFYAPVPTMSANFFYSIPATHQFKFRLKSNSVCSRFFSEWVTINPAVTTCSAVPTNLILTSQCAPSPPSWGCGAYVRWDNIPSAAGYQFEYLIYNLSGQSKTGTSSCSGNSFTFNDSVSSLGPGPWYVKFRVKSKCVNGALSDYSPWSAIYVW